MRPIKRKTVISAGLLGTIIGKGHPAFGCSEQAPEVLPGGVVDVTSFIKKRDGTPSGNRAAIQEAVNSLLAMGGGIVYFPPRTYEIDRTIEFNTGITFQGAGVASSTIYLRGAGSAFGPVDKNRHYYICFRDIYIRSDTRSVAPTAETVGIDLTNVSRVNINNIRIEFVTVGLRIRGEGVEIVKGESAPKAAHYIDIFKPDISTVFVGIECHAIDGGSANDTHVFGGRIADATTGIELNNVNNFQVQSTAIETFGVGMDLQNGVDGTKIIGCRFEPTNDPNYNDPDPQKSMNIKGIRVAAMAGNTVILGAYFVNNMREQIFIDPKGLLGRVKVY